MADTKISALAASTTPLAGTEVLPIVQSGVTKKVSVSDLTAGRAVSASSISSTSDATINGQTHGKGGGNIATNTAVGFSALSGANSGTGQNTAIGYQALVSNTSGNNNAASGSLALFSNTTGSFNTASGQSALLSNTIGNQNTASGRTALYYNTTGNSNTANGFQALLFNTTGFNNTANGVSALYSNTTGSYNTANGVNALQNNTTGVQNTANGGKALYYNTTGSNNTAYGYQALLNNTTGSGNTTINPMNSAGTYAPVFDPVTEDNRFCMGSTSVTNAYIQVAWTIVSDARDKTDFASVPHGLDFVTKLKPIAYRYKIGRDTEEGHGPVRYGFKAQDILALEGDYPVIVDDEDVNKLRLVDSSLIPVLVKAIQEQQALISSLTARLDAANL